MYTNILLPLDGSENSERALPHAQDLAKALGATLHLLQVVSVSNEMGYIHGGETVFVSTPQYRDLVDSIIGAAINQAETYLNRVKEGLESDGISVVTAVVQGAAADEINLYADRMGIDLTVISTRGQGGIQRFLVGSTTDRVLRSGSLPVLAIPPEY